MSLEGQLNRQFSAPERPKAPLPRKNANPGRRAMPGPAQQVATRPKRIVKAKPKPRSITSRENAPNAVAHTPSPLLAAARLALLHALTNPRAAQRAGETLGQGVNVGKQLIHQEGQALANKQLAKNVLKDGGGIAGKVSKAVGDVVAASPEGKFVKEDVAAATDVAKQLSKLGKTVVERGVTAPVVPGVGPKNVGGIHVPGAAAASISPQKVKGTIGGNLVQNAFDFPVQSIQSTYQLATHPEKTIKGYLKTGFLPALLSGHFATAAKRFNKNPGFSALEARGAVSVAGRGVGAGLRNVPGAKMVPGEASTTRLKGVGTPAAPIGKPQPTDLKPNLAGRLRLAGSQRRNPLKLTEGQPGQHVRRRYSADAGVKAVQVAADKVRNRQGADPNQASGTRLGRELRKRATAQTEIAEQNRRQVRAQEQKAATTPMKPTRRALVKAKVTEVLPLVKPRPVPEGVVPPKHGEGTVHAVAEGRIRSEATFVEDLRAELARMRAEQPSLKGELLTENKRNVRALDRALKAPDLQEHIPALMKAGKETAKATRGHGEDLVKAGVLDAEQARRARLMPYAVSHMGAKHNDSMNRLEVPIKTLFATSKKGPTRELPSAEIEAHMKANGVNPKEVGFVSHNAAKLGSGAFYKPSRLNRPTAGRARRTGEATQKGTMPTSQEALVAQRVSGVGQVEQAHQFDRMVKEMTIKPEHGSWATKAEAETEGRRRTTLGGEQVPGQPKQYVAVNMRPKGISADQASTIRALQKSDTRLSNADKLTNELAARMSADTGKGEWRLIAKPQWDMIRRQAEGRNELSRAVGAVTQQFKNAVLAGLPIPSVKWLTGNQVELYGIRMPAYGITPRTMRLGGKFLKTVSEQNEAEGRALAALAHQGRLFGTSPRMATHTAARQFEGGPAEPVANTMAKIRRTPGIKQAIDKVVQYQQAVFRFNGMLEGGGELGAIGKMAKETYADLGDFGHSWVQTARMGEQLRQDVAKEMVRDPNLKFEFARRVDEMLGKYNGFNPMLRSFIQSYSPFLPWYLNSARFIYWTLPVHHPIKTAVLVAAEEATQKTFQDRRDALRKFGAGGLAGALVRKDGGYVDVPHFTPAGAFTDIGSWGDVILPQLGSAIKASQGQDFTGKEIKVPTGARGPRGGVVTREMTDSEIGELVGNTLAEGLVPGIRTLKTVFEGGRTSQPNSYVYSPKMKGAKTQAAPLSVGPVTLPPAANRLLNPLRPTYLHPPKKGAKKPRKPRKGRKPKSGGSIWSSGGTSSGGGTSGGSSSSGGSIWDGGSSSSGSSSSGSMWK